MIDITATDLNALGTVALRKLARELGLKGLSSARGADLRTAIEPIKAQQIEAAKPAPAPVAKAPKKGSCEDCGRKVGNSGHPTLCTPCYDYAGWENTHSDAGHEQLKDSMSDADLEGEIGSCPVCHPELDPRTARKSGKSRAGMVIIAKGTEVHKSTTFKQLAEAKGWKVNVSTEVTTITEDDEEFEIEVHVAVAVRGNDSISLVWNGRAYDYSSSAANLNGKLRKVRNLKEATRLI